MADLVLSPIVDLLVEKVVDYFKDQYKLSSDIKEKLEKLKRALYRIQAVTNVADEVEIKDKNLLCWLMDLKEAAYEAEDLLDEFEYQRLERQVATDDEDDDGGGQRKRAKLGYFPLPNIFKRFTQSNEQLEKLASIQHRFEELATATGDFLKLVRREQKRKKGCDKGRETTSFITVPEFVGRTEKLEEIVHLLLVVDDGSASKQVRVVPIVGPGGFGKTTLARHVFNDPRVVDHFQPRLWVHVSENFDVKRLTREMIESASASERRCDHIENLDRLQRELQEAVGSKRFLLVLDDIWCGGDSPKTEQLHLTEEGWRKLFAPLAAGARGSMVLLTSRTQEVARLPDALPPVLLGGLVDDECWEIIQACAFSGDSDPAGYQNLVEIGKQIASKVKGSPLAASAVGGMLRNNRDGGYWSRLLDTGLRELPGVMDVLNLSYQHLPPHLRKCFAYCSLFPKGHQFDRSWLDELGYMWVAQGFIRPRPGETMEEAGRKCFNDLLSRSFFQIYRDNYSEVYVMHDLMNDLARNVSRGDCLGYEGGNLWEDNIPETVRHLSVSPKHLAELSKRGCKFGNLRSFLILTSYGEPEDEILIIKEMLKQLRRVRVLSLDYCDVIELPDDVSDWIHLRFLGLHANRIKRLPESLCRLYHLQVLTVRSWRIGRAFPRKKMNHLTNLRILNTLEYIAFIGRLTSLEVLKAPFRVRRERGYEIGQLKDLNGLRGKLTICNLANVETRQEAEAANLCGKRWLEELTLRWDSKTAARSPDVDEEVLEALQPHSDLKQLTIYGYGGSTCPSWMFNQKLNTIKLVGLIRLVRLPPLGQLSYLKFLELTHLPTVRQLCGHEFYGGDVRGFPSLERLTIEDMDELEEWSGLDDGPWFPRLQQLAIKNCPKLRSLAPLGHLPSLKYLEMRKLHASKDLGHQVYRSGGDGTRCFPSLEKLEIYDMPELEWWSGLDGSQWFSRLQNLTISACPKLKSLPPLGHLPSLKYLKMRKLHSAKDLGHQVYLSGGDGTRCFPSLEQLFIDEMPELEWWYERYDNRWFPRLHNLTISACPKLKSLPPLGHLPSLRYLKMRKLHAAKDLGHQIYLSGGGGTRCFPSLEKLGIYNMPELEEWWSGLDGSQWFPRLCTFNITNCPKLRTLPAISPTLKKIAINHVGLFALPRLDDYCDDAGMQREGAVAAAVLSELCIVECPNLSSLGEGLLHNQRRLRHLKKLVIKDCEQLVSPLAGGFRELVSLEILRIENCPKLTLSIQNQGGNGGPLPSSLKYLDACHAFGDEALFGCGLTNLSGLRMVRWPCIPRAELLRHFTMLQELIIVDCEALTHSELAGVQALLSLKKLAIKGCPRLLTETSSPTPEDVAGTAFSSSLEHLGIDHLLLLTTVPILKTLSSLEKLSITVAFQGTSFPTEGEEFLLRNCTTLQTIEIFGAPSFKSLPDSLQCLSSVVALKIYDAPELRSLPDLPNSLKNLLIGHPHIELKTRYQKDLGPDWHKIQHINRIDIGQSSDHALQHVASDLVHSD